MQILSKLFFAARFTYITQVGLQLSIFLPQPLEEGLQACTTTLALKTLEK
jgi:hypothetical protein